MSEFYFDKNGKAVGFEEYIPLFGDADYRRVGFASDGKYDVSTVWLGFAHGEDDDGSPLIFETMVFSEGGGTVEMTRYSTLEKAQEGHREFVLRWIPDFDFDTDNVTGKKRFSEL